MAVITKFIVVRNGIELDQVFSSKKEAEAHDKMLDAAEGLAELMRKGKQDFTIDGKTIDAISVYLAQNAAAVTKILKNVKPFKPKTGDAGKDKSLSVEPAEDKKKAPGPRAKSKGN